MYKSFDLYAHLVLLTKQRLIGLMSSPFSIIVLLFNYCYFLLFILSSKFSFLLSCNPRFFPLLTHRKYISPSFLHSHIPHFSLFLTSHSFITPPTHLSPTHPPSTSFFLTLSHTHTHTLSLTNTDTCSILCCRNHFHSHRDRDYGDCVSVLGTGETDEQLGGVGDGRRGVND